MQMIKDWSRKVFQKAKDSRQVPNTLTWIRLGLFWLPGWLIWRDPTSWWGLIAFFAIVLTDKIDGYIARRWEQVSKWGQEYDPLADKFLVIVTVFALCWTNMLASPFGWAFLAFNLVREVSVPYDRYRRLKGKATLFLPADDDGKRKMFFQSAGIGLALFPFTFWWWQIVIWLPLVLSLFYSVRSGRHYLRAK